MLFTLLLLGLLAQSTSEAIDLENAGRYEDALEAYQRLAAANPNDHHVRLAIGRLHLRLRRPERAEPVYRGVVLEDAANMEARLGLADALLAQWRSEEALEVLESAEAVAPDHPGVLARLGRAYERVGHSTQAVAYLERAAGISAIDADRFALERARQTHDHRLELRSFGEDMGDDAPDAHGADLSLGVRLTDTLRATGRGQYQRQFSTTDARGGVGLAWRWTPSTTLAAQAIVGPGNRVMPRGDYLAEIDYAHAVTNWTASVRFFDFDGAQVTTVSPGVTWWPSDRLSVGLRYALSLTDADGVSGTSEGHTAHVRTAFQVRPRIRVHAGYARGVEDFEHFSIDRVGAFRAHTGSIGARFDLRSLTSVVGTYERQSRHDDVELQRFTMSLAQRF